MESSPKESQSRVVRDTVIGGTWLMLNSLATSVLGLVFWILASRLAGLEAVGLATSLMSAAMIATTLLSAGLNLASLREMAASRGSAFYSILAVGLLLGVLAGGVGVLLALVLGSAQHVLVGAVFLMAFSMVLNQVGIGSLMGLELFRRLFVVGLLSNVLKIIVLILLVYTWFSMLAPLIGILVFMLAITLSSLASVIPHASKGLQSNVARRMVVLTLSNYPYVFSIQLMTSLSVYLFSFLTQKTADTGFLYLSLMVAVSILAFPNALLEAALPIGIRSGAETFIVGTRLGLVLTTPLITLIAFLPETVFGLITEGKEIDPIIVRLVLLSIAPLAILTATIMKLNKSFDKKLILILGGTMLLLLTALLVLLIPPLGTRGAAIAFLTAPLVTSVFSLKLYGREVARLYLFVIIHSTAAILAFLAGPESILKAISASIVSTLILFTLKLISLDEIKLVLTIIRKT